MVVFICLSLSELLQRGFGLTPSVVILLKLVLNGDVGILKLPSITHKKSSVRAGSEAVLTG